jgi:hypothetical protein
MPVVPVSTVAHSAVGISNSEIDIRARRIGPGGFFGFDVQVTQDFELAVLVCDAKHLLNLNPERSPHGHPRSLLQAR